MGAAAVAARLLLGGVLLVAALGKRRDPAWPTAARAFGTPAPLIPLVPVAELLVGAFLALQVRPAAFVAAGLLVVFSAGIAANLLRGRRPPCACFGGSDPRPVGARTLARNAALLGLAVVASFGR